MNTLIKISSDKSYGRIRGSIKEIIELSDQNNLLKFKWSLKKDGC